MSFEIFLNSKDSLYQKHTFIQKEIHKLLKESLLSEFDHFVHLFFQKFIWMLNYYKYTLFNIYVIELKFLQFEWEQESML